MYWTYFKNIEFFTQYRQLIIFFEIKYKMVAWKRWPLKSEVEKITCFLLIIQIMLLKQFFKELSYFIISYLLSQHTQLF